MKDPWIVAYAFSCPAALLLAGASTPALAGSRNAERTPYASWVATLVGTLTRLEERLP